MRQVACCDIKSYILTFLLTQQCIAGASVWNFVSVDGGVEPDVYVSITLMSVLMPVHVIIAILGTLSQCHRLHRC